MHESAMKYGQVFFQTYCSGDYSGKTIVDVGSQDVNGSLRDFCPSGATYVGVDFVEGPGVDIVINDPYRLPFEDESADVIVCSSVFEHSDFFWLLFLECLRILRPAGLIYLNAPSNGMVHRYPVDSWRFYPDSGHSLTKWANYNAYNSLLLESFVGAKHGPMSGEGIWNDFVAIFVKDNTSSSQHPRRIQDLAGEFYQGYSYDRDCKTVQCAHVPDHSLLMEHAKRIDHLVQTANVQNLAIEEQERKLSTYIHEITALKDSTSWKLTSPLRLIKKTSMNFFLKTKPLLYIALRKLWHAAPLPGHRKVAIRNFLLSLCGGGSVKFDIPTVKFDLTQEAYTAYKVNPPIDPTVKLIAFYLPQFHPFPENDEWWGKGFTEWYNVGRASQNYIGHYQPHCPIHNGYYDLRIPSVMEEQALLAKQYGLHGFSYYFYWFAGKTLMDTPLEMMLKNPKVDIPFCLTWANENWTRRWDGQDNDVLISQDHSSEDSIAFIRHLVKYFKDPRYIKINDQPLLIIYRANIIPDIEQSARLWREEIKKHGFSDIYLVCAQSFGIRGPEEFGFNASVEFPPHTVKSHEISGELTITNPEFKGNIFSYEQTVSASIAEPEPDYKLFRTLMLSWDNTARKQNHSHSFHGFSLTRYKQWLSAVCSNVSHSRKYNSYEKLVFINAWNEWAEGTHLEPDRKYGYGYLQATYDVISCYDRNLNSTKRDSTKINNYAFALHIHYPELWPEIKTKLDNTSHFGFDLYVTTTSKEAADLVRADFPDAIIELDENRGRDIFPLTKIIDRIYQKSYRAVCKLHTKRSIYRDNGNEIREELFDCLVGDKETVASIIKRFELDSTLGMIIPENYLITHTYRNMKYNHETVKYACKTLDLKFKYDTFPAGSMFWFKPEALRDLNKFKSSDFDVEHGLADGTLPHGIERIFCLLAKKSGYRVETC
ncbi:glycoside hydrolase family 99-like domain-containing protein [Pseudomonas sp. G.S.17]|uniref:glycoside hydrolase family 99-like domain-containing protein n=1 Tax=Pseudomonas sp. G.S.17 TaxID=3137451 RepID=UPI00311C8D11